jgi:SAM-dependent methyltransferase
MSCVAECRFPGNDHSRINKKIRATTNKGPDTATPDRAAEINEVKGIMAEIIKLEGARQLDFDREMVEQAYDRWAPIYDLVFGGVFSKGRRAAILATNNIGGRVLEVGVGTGISLPQYAPHLRIFGTDISEAMLRKAKRRVDELRLKNV